MAEELTRRRSPVDAASAAGAYVLVFVGGERVAGRRVSLEAGEVVLGRDPACEVPLVDEDVSRRHARLVADGDGHQVVDLGSTNGTWVNGRAVQVARLAPGDRLQLGSCVARYLRAGDAEERELAHLADLARTDALTALPNRRAFDEALQREVARARSGALPLVAAVLDIDHFKRVNDRFGHAAGDAVIAEVAARARAALRGEDLLARVGGEELAALLPGIALEDAAAIAERVRAAVAAAPITPRTGGGAALEITVSLGCAALGVEDADGDALLARADARLYQAKRGGRNRVVA